MLVIATGNPIPFELGQIATSTTPINVPDNQFLYRRIRDGDVIEVIEPDTKPELEE